MDNLNEKVLSFARTAAICKVIGEFLVLAGDILAYGRWSDNRLIELIGLITMIVGFVMYLFPNQLVKINPSFRKLEQDPIQDQNKQELTEMKDIGRMLGWKLIAVAILFSIALIVCGFFLLSRVTGSWNEAVTIVWAAMFLSDLRKCFQIENE